MELIAPKAMREVRRGRPSLRRRPRHGGFRIGRGQALVLGCALAFAVHILLLDRFTGDVDVLRLASFQLRAVAIAALVPAHAPPAPDARSVGGHAIGARIAPRGFLGAALVPVGILVSELPLDRTVNQHG
ncbi:MAG TPA: hypothetical protein VM143_06900 [Acidimicrobiales bacterium]|nr:hypothetical protein [Acidimicrobiales bacterium]